MGVIRLLQPHKFDFTVGNQPASYTVPAGELVSVSSADETWMVAKKIADNAAAAISQAQAEGKSVVTPQAKWAEYNEKSPQIFTQKSYATLADFNADVSESGYAKGPLWIGGVQYYSDGTSISAIGGGSGFANPRIVKNILLRTKRFETGVVVGTGVATSVINTTTDGVKNPRLQCVAGSSGRAYANLNSNPVESGKWYVLSFEVFSVSFGADTGNIACNRYSGATIDRGTALIDFVKIANGGPGRYATAFRASSTGNIDFRVGVGTNVAVNGQSMTIGNYMLEEINPDNGFTPSEYVYPGYSAVFNRNRNAAIDPATNKVIEAAYFKTFAIKTYSNILLAGDSRSDEITDIGGQLQTLMNADGSGNANWHAQGGWKVTDIISDGVNKGVSFNLEKLISNRALTCSWSTDGDEEIYDYLYPNAYPFDTLLLADFGYNSIVFKIAQAKTFTVAAQETIDELNTIVSAAVAAGMKIIMTDNNPFGAFAGVTADQISGVKLLNKYIENYCRQNGHLFISIYQALSDATTEDNLAAAYSTDGLHPNSAGTTLIATKIKAAIDSYKL